MRWRPFGQAAFDEAAAAGKPVFFVLTAPWTWDHFLLSARLFEDPRIRAPLEQEWIPVLADASVHPELRARYAIETGLLPSFHFLDATGRPFASAAPLGVEELAFRLEEWRHPAGRPDPAEAPEPALLEVNESKIPNRVARYLADLSEKGELPVARPHQDIDPGGLLFLIEAGEEHVPRRAAAAIGRELGRLRASALRDTVDGGFHRAAAFADLSLPHFEKTLGVNARLGSLLAIQFRRTRNVEVGHDALLVLRLLNDGLRVDKSPLYAESMAADLYDPRAQELVATGSDYYGRNEAGRRVSARPPKSEFVTPGSNGAVLAMFWIYATVFEDGRVIDAARRMTLRLLAEGFLADGSARAAIGRAEPAGLRAQAEAGLGMLAAHSLSGSPEALAAAERVGRILLEKFRDPRTHLFLGASSDAGWPGAVRAASVDPAANGLALRCLAELAALTRDREWIVSAQRGVEAWASRAPADGRGLGELAAAAYRVEAPPPVFLLRADPGTAEAERLLRLVLELGEPFSRIRWIRSADAKDARRLFDVEIEEAPALYLVWGGPSVALRDAEILHAVFRDAQSRAAGR